MKCMLYDLPRFKKWRMKYISSTHKVNKRHADSYIVKAGETFTMAEIEGPGIIASLWLTISSPDKNILRRAILRIYWDHEEHPSVECPVGDFFGAGFSQYIHYHAIPLGMTSGGYYCFFPMPFNSARIELINMSELDIRALFYMIGYYQVESVDDMGRFHAVWRRERVVKRGEPYLILDAEGRGHLVGVVLSMEGYDREVGGGLGFLEGNMEILADGELAYGSTGTEDYFLSGWYFEKGTFNAPFHGLLIKDTKNLRIVAYRFHIPDPIPFEKSLLVRIHHGEWDEVMADYSSVAYWYQTEPHKVFTSIRGEDLV